MCVVCACYFSHLSTSFVFKSLNVIRFSCVGLCGRHSCDQAFIVWSGNGRKLGSFLSLMIAEYLMDYKSTIYSHYFLIGLYCIIVAIGSMSCHMGCFIDDSYICYILYFHVIGEIWTRIIGLVETILAVKETGHGRTVLSGCMSTGLMERDLEVCY